MEQPKFRGFCLETNQWHYGHGWFECDYTEEYKKEKDMKDRTILYTEGSPVECELESMGHYTGLKDKNGREIYEGDICNFGNYTEPPLVVKYVQEKSALCLVCAESDEQYLFNDFHYEELIVLGNTYEDEGVFY